MTVRGTVRAANGRSIKDTIMPTVLNNGKILRFEYPAYPSPDCLFADPKKSGKPFKVFNAYNGCGALCVFDIDEDEKSVYGKISACDMQLNADADYCMYDWFAKAAFKLCKGDSLEVCLKDYDDFKLYLFVPVKNGKAVVGLAEKYMSVLTFKENNGVYSFADSGPVCIYSKNGVSVNGKPLKSIGNGSTYVFVAEKDAEYKID